MIYPTQQEPRQAYRKTTHPHSLKKSFSPALAFPLGSVGGCWVTMRRVKSRLAGGGSDLRGLRCSTAHHAADTSPGLLSHSPRASRSPPRCSSAPSPGRLRPPSQPSSPAPPQGLRLRERRGEGGASRSSSPRGGVKVRKGVAEPGRPQL